MRGHNICFNAESKLSPNINKHSLLSRSRVLEAFHRFATVRENNWKMNFFRSGKSQGILWLVRGISEGLEKSGTL